MKEQKALKTKGALRTLITAALPYANGPIHLGHLVEYIQTDIFSRFLKLKGEKAIFCCADDTHGTAIEISAQKLGVIPEKLISDMHQEHLQDFTDFHIHFDSYYSTNSPENKKYSDFIFSELKKKGLIYKKEVELTYCNKCKRFLPDRYVKGKCPKCGADDQYGDVCEKCNSAYSTTDLVDPFCAICGSSPVKRKSEHYFFKLSACANDLKRWFESNKNLQSEVKNYLLNWAKEGLKDWDITRDGPYFGFKIPGEENLYYYVWLDAPVGYISSTENYCKSTGGKEKTEDYWKSKDSRIIHFIGKDIIYFHFLFWPAMLMNSGFNLPDDIVVHGFLTINKEKMSKSRGTFFTAKDYLKALDPSYLRFYYASNLTKTMSDIDLDFNDFKSKINNELVGNLGNFVYRVLSFANKNLNSEIRHHSEPELQKKLKEKYIEIEKAYESYNFREAVKLILEVSAIGNKYFQENKPWELIKNKDGKEKGEEKAREVIGFCVNLVKDISILIKPIIPKISEEIERQVGVEGLKWEDLLKDVKKNKINEARILIKKIENEVDRLAVKDPFSMLDLRIARVLEAKQHPNADKLLILQIDTGLDKRQICAGLAAYYKPEELVGKNIVVVRNLKPARLRGEVSAGMLLAGEDEKTKTYRVLEAKGARAGERVYAEGISLAAENELKEITMDDFLKVKLEVNEGKAVYKGQLLKAGKEEIICDVKKGKVS
ncbi:MAG: methionine--tRNA ligase [Candidatus Woesearchaeota archaeon]|nr:methionine--tRNA ligase [Candidatus Woesearchaeota archaeon]